MSWDSTKTWKNATRYSVLISRKHSRVSQFTNIIVEVNRKIIITSSLLNQCQVIWSTVHTQKVRTSSHRIQLNNRLQSNPRNYMLYG